MIQKIPLKAWELMFSLLVLFLALFYVSIAFDGGLHRSIQAALAVAFVPVSFFWRIKPLLSSFLMVMILYAWSFNWITALPTNLGLTPFFLFLPVAVYRVSRQSDSKRWVTGIALLAFLYCVISPVMWQFGPDGMAYRSLEQAISWLLVQWLALSIVLQFGRAERKQEQQRELDRRIKEQSNLEKLRKIQDQERMQIAREIHDILAHSLTLINVQASAGEIAGKTSADKSNNAQEEALKNIRRISSDSLVEVRGIVRALRDNTSKSQEQGLTGLSNMHSQLENFSKAGLKIHADLPSQEDMQELVQSAPLITQLAVRRIIDESLTNILRHQGVETSTSIKMLISFAANELSLVITSKSKGKSVEAFEGSGSGLIGMQERVANLGGWITFKHKDGMFSVTASVPILPR
ncbi:sensor histidine kinase [Corynebacterium propinquum]|uniref:sensor histidine kinase n=1 Tax=Corynebacterium propinquum TaxID=43769 RepID=UPI000667B92A|nr:histidine kinase [Corynebacterium propinquum]